MTRTRSSESLVGLVRELLKLPKETEWVEFKHDNDNPEEIGEYISALANSAALDEKAFAYVVWGIENATRRVLGTRFDPMTAKRGNEELESWLLHKLEPRIDFRFFEVVLPEGRVVVLEIGRAFRHPVKFDREKYVRVGSYKKRLKDFPEKERALWRLLDKEPFERGIAAERVPEGDVSRLLDVSAYFRLVDAQVPSAQASALEALAAERLIQRGESGGWDVTNLGAILFAAKLSEFGRLKRKAMRVVSYPGDDRTRAEREQEGGKGYATGFEGLIAFVNGLVPTNEVIKQALRKAVPMYPEVAVRHREAKQRGRLSSDRGRRRGRTDRPDGPQRGAEGDALRALVGGRPGDLVMTDRRGGSGRKGYLTGTCWAPVSAGKRPRNSRALRGCRVLDGYLIGAGRGSGAARGPDPGGAVFAARSPTRPWILGSVGFFRS